MKLSAILAAAMLCVSAGSASAQGRSWTPVPGIGIHRGISSVTGTAGMAKRLIGACEDSG
jgi:hypothetical protein